MVHDMSTIKSLLLNRRSFPQVATPNLGIPSFQRSELPASPGGGGGASLAITVSKAAGYAVHVIV
jgi:hypothetical protein